LVHRATISRPVVTREEGKTVASAPVPVVAGVHVWAEGIGPAQRALLVGRRDHARYTLSWMDDEFRSEDVVTLTEPALGTYVLRGIQHDIQGEYWFGTLEERAS
jgi:hypothetical protein